MYREREKERGETEAVGGTEMYQKRERGDRKRERERERN